MAGILSPVFRVNVFLEVRGLINLLTIRDNLVLNNLGVLNRNAIRYFYELDLLRILH